MKLTNIFTVYQKELRDTTRDKRTLYAMVVMPVVIMPLLIWGIGKFSAYQQQQNADKTVNIAVLPSQQTNPLIQFIARQPKIHLTTNNNLTDVVKKETVDAAIQLPSNAQQLEGQHRPVTLTFLQKSVRSLSDQALIRVNTAVEIYNTHLITSRLTSQHLNPSLLSAVTVTPQDLSTTQEKTGFGLSFILPIFIVMWAITGGQYTAIDASAGERERKTLEALLLTPASRLDLVIGKFLAVASVSLVSVLLSIVSLYFTVGNLVAALTKQSDTTGSAFSQLNLAASLTPQAILLMVGVSFFLALLFAAILLTVGIFAKSYREAQSYMAPAYIIIILPVSLLNAVPDLQVPAWVYLIPPVNAVMLFKEILQGVYNSTHISFTLLTLILASALAIIIATRIFQQERVLFKS